MIRPLTMLAVLALGLSAVQAQETPAPTAPQIVVDPNVSLNTSPKQVNMLTGLYAILAGIDICAIPIEPAIADGINADKQRLETTLGMDADAVTAAYGKIRADVESTQPDCAEGSANRQSIDEVIAIYTPAPAAATPAVTAQ